MLKDLFTEISPRPLGLARVMVGAAAVVRAWVTWSVVSRLADTDVMLSPHFGWLPEPTTTLAIAVTAIWVASALLFTLGWRVAISGPVLLVTIAFTISLDQQLYSNHLYLMAWLVLLLTLADAGAGLNIRRHDRPVVLWPTMLLMLQTSFVYGFSALTKLNPDYLSGGILAGTLGTGLLPFPDALRIPALLSVLATITVIVELFIAVFLWRRRFRPAAIFLGFALHASITLLMFGTLQLFVFSLEMLALYPLFLSRGKLVVVWDDDCEWCGRWVSWFDRLDVLRSLNVLGKKSDGHPFAPEDVEVSIHLLHHERVTKSFAAVTPVLEHLVPTLWVAPVLRLPGVRHVGERIYRWQARRRSCGITRSFTPESSTAR